MDECLMTHNEYSIHKRMLVLVSEIFGSIIFETYKSMSHRYTPLEMSYFFSKEKLIETIRPVLELTYAAFTQELLHYKEDTQLSDMVNLILEKITVFGGNINRTYLFNASMMLGIVIVLQMSIDTSKPVSQLSIKEELVNIGFKARQFTRNYFPILINPMTKLEIRIK